MDIPAGSCALIISPEGGLEVHIPDENTAEPSPMAAMVLACITLMRHPDLLSLVIERMNADIEEMDDDNAA